MAASALPYRLAGRYEIKAVLGQGGMGLVYRAFDTVIRREVALKTLRDIPEATSLQLFHKEAGVLASMSHPNIVEIFDIGEFEENGKRKPYFVMPLLPGTTLDDLIRNASHRLTVERTIGMISQVCRGLQAAHERGLVHRDLKPSNIFVMEDDAVKIIDFGVAHMTNTHSTVGLKGTLIYMSPEQLDAKPLSALSDMFSLSVVCYEALTGRQPFRRAREEDVVEAIRNQTPPPVSELNSAVSEPVSRVIHKAMAKQPLHRFSTTREFAETLNKAFRNEPIEFFDPARLQPRVERATRALEQGDHEFAGEILAELEAEGHMETSVMTLRRQLDQSVRQKKIAQLLAMAKARFDEQEDPLALQKIQEILQIEADNAAALGLKSKIESRRSERQIENWYRLAQQHMENRGYPHAREALQNVLQLRPKEERALQLLAEVERQEQEYKKLRQEKVQLHRAAMDAWQKGDVSNALTKLGMVLELDRKAPDSSSPERTSYQNLYDQVRSEHDAVNNGYAEARKHIADRNLTRARTLCDNWLSKYPNNAVFQALKFDIEEQRRQNLSAFIATVDRQIEAEPDLDKQVGILKGALSQHPDETHFQRALRLVEEKRDLVNSIVARARFHEEQGQFADAISDWEILRTIYGRYPGLKFEVERLEKRREQQAENEAKVQWTEQIDASMRTADYSHSLTLLQQAEAEFPGDAELAQLKNTAEEGRRRNKELQQLITDGQDLCATGNFAEGLKRLRRAHELDEHNPVARAVLCSVLVERAQAVLETEWQAAQDLLQQVLDIDPGNNAAKSLRPLVLDRKKQHLVDECISRARRLQAVADMAGAMAQVNEGLSSYPHETRLLHMRETLQKEMAQHEERQNRRRDLEELRQLERDAEQTKDLSAIQSYRDRAQTVAGKYSGDKEFASLSSDLLRFLSSMENRRETVLAEQPADDKPDTPNATLLFSPAAEPPRRAPMAPPSQIRSKLQERPQTRIAQPERSPSVGKGAAALTKFKELLARASAAARAAAQRVQIPKQIPKLDTASILNRWQALNKKMLALGAGGFVVLLIITVLLVKIIHRPTRVEPAELTFHIHTSPAGATIRLNGEVKGTSDLDVNLPPGNYQVDAQLDGYQASSSSLEAKAGVPDSVVLTLQPLLAVMRLTADSGGKVWFDDQPAVELQGDQWALPNVASGRHKLKFAGPQGQISFGFTTDSSSLPAVKGALNGKGAHVLVVASAGNHFHVYCNCAPAKVSVDGQNETDIATDGADISNVAPGDHSLSLKMGAEQHTVDLAVEPGAALTTYLLSDRDIGTLIVETGEDKVQVFLDNQLQKKTTQGGQLRIPNLAPKDYVVRVAKAGFQDAPEQKISLHKGDRPHVKFNLVAIPHLASLAIQGAPAGSEVLLDGQPVGTVQSDGTFQSAGLAPGDHVIAIQKDGFQQKKIQKHFAAGGTTALSASEVSLERVTSQVQISFSPTDASVALVKGSDAPIKVTSGANLTVSPGHYELTTRVGSVSRSVPVDIAAGAARSIGPLSLAPGTIQDFEDAAGWKPEQEWFTRRGGNFALYKRSSVPGVFIFSAALQKGHRLQWVFDYVDDKNYILFQLDDSYFYRSVMQNGETHDETKIPFKSDKKSSHTFQISVSPGRIVHQIQQGNAWVNLDSWSQSGRDASAGKFGFYIPDKDEVAISNFSYYGELKLP
jgi:tRNA A-37 threonylcarbamoyl transferase component Bud32/cytochrome c-type biogenesis protein CcmH/NrfG